MAQAIVIVAVRKSTDMQRDHWNRNGTCILAAGTRAIRPTLVLTLMVNNGYT
jgi:hypothetical protein